MVSAIPLAVIVQVSSYHKSSHRICSVSYFLFHARNGDSIRTDKVLLKYDSTDIKIARHFPMLRENECGNRYL